MLNEILDEIRIAEKEAEETAKKAEEDAKQTVFNADEEARKIRLETLKTVKEERRKVVEQAEKCGDEKADAIIAEGKIFVQKIVTDTPTEKAAEYIKEKVSARYVNR